MNSYDDGASLAKKTSDFYEGGYCTTVCTLRSILGFAKYIANGDNNQPIPVVLLGTDCDFDFVVVLSTQVSNEWAPFRRGFVSPKVAGGPNTAQVRFILMRGQKDLVSCFLSVSPNKAVV